jgi:pimeloyl-ACP methyl ester carboxylesterase
MGSPVVMSTIVITTDPRRSRRCPAGRAFNLRSHSAVCPTVPYDRRVVATTFDVASADGARFTVTAVGNGKPILILHPGGSGSSSWRGVATFLAARFRVLLFDRRPYRLSGEVEPAATIANEVRDVAAIAEIVGEPMLLVGHSSGAVIALEAALVSPARFAGIVLYEPPVAVSAPLGGEPLTRANEALATGDPGRAMKIHLREIAQARSLLVSLVALFPPLWRQMTMFAAGQINDDNELESLGVGIDRYAHVDIPTLLLGGARSPRHLRDRLDALSAVMPHVESVVILKRQGHLANARAPRKVARIIETFANAAIDSTHPAGYEGGRPLPRTTSNPTGVQDSLWSPPDPGNTDSERSAGGGRRL